MPSVLYHCMCLSSSPIPPPPQLPSSSYSFHPLHTLFFCEECDAVRCNRCVSVEISGYYCPNCLFEVPGASVRAEKNRCARNCFLCPNCRNTLSVVPSDPVDPGDGRAPSIPVSIGGEPPFMLFCNYCRWDSMEVGIKFDKPTGLAAQLQKDEDGAVDTVEFEALKDHFEPILRAAATAQASQGSSSSTLHATSHHMHAHKSSITAAASAALSRDIPGVAKYNPGRSVRGANAREKGNEDEIPTYKTRLKCADSKGHWGGDADVEWMRHIETIGEVATLEQRWSSSWMMSLRSEDLRPLRIPLHAKTSKRCPSCAHILIKPEQKAQSVRYKIKLVAANYLPAITVTLPHAQPSKRVVTKAVTEEEKEASSRILAGKTYPFHLALTNPLYDPIQVRLSVQRVHVSAPTESGEKSRRPPFAISLPTASFSIAAFAEAWEYDDDEDMFGLDDDELLLGRKSGQDTSKKGKSKTVGVLEKKANVTVIGGEVVIGKEARGNVKFNMLVSYTYRSDDPAPSEGPEGSSAKSASRQPEVKTFSFYTVVELGVITPKEEARADQEL